MVVVALGGIDLSAEAFAAPGAIDGSILNIVHKEKVLQVLAGHSEPGFAELNPPALQERHLVLDGGELMEDAWGAAIPNGIGRLELSFALMPEFVHPGQGPFHIHAQGVVFGPENGAGEGRAGERFLVTKGGNFA